ncbi:DUF2589 domain-containing protein [uncultured Psychroserpens sp.]|uniref:DUF2589 domain-containing protein n=1 Tax=uncultured Psychroserpens sp. TaxID=255436 RepID=UPI00260919F3|nr:DUF2589 domain-containing protein [uncultured Psychroserpens sp.]
MAIDTTPSTVATNALDALDFSSLIGGPMDAIIKAQALAAKTTYEFINEVGLTTDPDTGEKKPVNVTFQYNSGGKVATLTVPLLVILTVPNIEVSNFVIDFIANISASSSSTEETSSDTELGVDVEAEASLGIGPFSIKVKAKANYSSKQHSKAAKESKYSVEYTMNVRVEGGQSDMPAGLQTVLSILQGSNTSVGPDDMIVTRPKNVNIDGVNKATLEIVVKDAQGYLASGTEVALNLDANSPFKEINILRGHTRNDILIARQHLSNSLYSKNRKENKEVKTKHLISHRVIKPYMRRFKNSKIKFDSTASPVTQITGVTDTSGVVVFELVLEEGLTKDQQGNITVTSYIPISDGEGESSVREEITNVPYTILIPDDKGGSLVLTSDKSTLNLNSTTTSETIKVTVKDLEGNTVDGEKVAFEILGDTANDDPAASFKATSISGTKTSGNNNGTFDVKIETIATPATGNYTLKLKNDSSNELKIPVTVT